MRILSSTVEWVAFNAVVILLLLTNLFFHRKERKISFADALLWSIFWICLALCFAVYVYFFHGKEKSLEFITGYLVEKLLSLDNLFVFLLIFKYFRTPTKLLHFVLFWGILGAIVMRGIFIFLGVAMLQYFHFVIYIFGAFLLYLGIKFAFFQKNEVHPEKNIFIKIFSKFIPFSSEYEGHKFFVRKDHTWMATPLFVVLLAIESSDLVFAIDSVPAILAITRDPFIVYTAIIFAILGLRSLFFVLVNLIEKFRYLHYAMGLILAIVGLKMLLSDVIEVPVYFILIIVLVVIGVFILLSLLVKRRKKI